MQAECRRLARGTPADQFSGQNVLDDFAEHVCQTHIPSAEAVSEPFVVHAQQMQDGGMQVVDFHFVFHDMISVVISRAVDRASLNAATA